MTVKAVNVFGNCTIYSTHPGSDISLVSAIGTRSKEVAYGNKGDDFILIAGGI